MSSSRKNKLRAASVLFLLTLAHAFLVESRWVAVRHVAVRGNPRHRLVHVSDIHHAGDEAYLTDIVDRINRISPDFVCVTGDIVDEARHLKEALEILGKITCPLFGVPGNHEYWGGASFDDLERAFAARGGEWLVNERVFFGHGELEVVGLAFEEYKSSFAIHSADQKESGREAGEHLRLISGDGSAKKRVLLVHYPAFADKVPRGAFDLILAGHSHGGQVRVPILGPLILPTEVGEYDRGFYETPGGPLYVNPGIGTFAIPARLFCRPEITVITF